MKPKILEYKYEFPKYFIGQNVVTITYLHGTKIGKIRDVETHYDKNRAFHIYKIQIKGWNQELPIREDKIVTLYDYPI